MKSRSKKVVERVTRTSDDIALKEAIDNVYKKYGTNLDAFYRDMDAEIEIKREHPPETRLS